MNLAHVLYIITTKIIPHTTAKSVKSQQHLLIIITVWLLFYSTRLTNQTDINFEQFVQLLKHFCSGVEILSYCG